MDRTKIGAMSLEITAEEYQSALWFWLLIPPWISSFFRLQTGTLLNLSEQQLIDCSWGFGNRGCKGGYPHRAMQWVIKHGGLATEKSYGRYLAQVRSKAYSSVSSLWDICLFSVISKHVWSQLLQAVTGSAILHSLTSDVNDPFLYNRNISEITASGATKTSRSTVWLVQRGQAILPNIL